MEDKVDKQMAAPADENTQLAPNEKTLTQECGWKGGDSGDSAVKNLVQ